jgi:hypothetical protein
VADPSFDALLRAQEKALSGLGEAWDLVLKATARAPVPGARGASEGVQHAVEALAALVGTASGPLRALVDGQRELADKLERWAELQRDTADVVSALAKQQKLTADLLGAAIAPLYRAPDVDRPSS